MANETALSIGFSEDGKTLFVYGVTKTFSFPYAGSRPLMLTDYTQLKADVIAELQPSVLTIK